MDLETNRTAIIQLRFQAPTDVRSGIQSIVTVTANPTSAESADNFLVFYIHVQSKVRHWWFAESKVRYGMICGIEGAPGMIYLIKSALLIIFRIKAGALLMICRIEDALLMIHESKMYALSQIC